MNERTMNDCCKRAACSRHLANGITATERKINGQTWWEINDNHRCDGCTTLYHSVESYFQSICMEVWRMMSDANEMLNFDLLLRDGYGVPERTIDAVLYDNKFEHMTPYKLFD